MKKILYSYVTVLLLVILFFSGSLCAQEITIDRIWVDGDYAYALVTFKNTSTKTYKRSVTIKCIAYDASGNKLGINTRSFFCFNIGPIEPGFEDTLKVPIELHGAIMHYIKCSSRAR